MIRPAKSAKSVETGPKSDVRAARLLLGKMRVGVSRAPGNLSTLPKKERRNR